MYTISTRRFCTRSRWDDRIGLRYAPAGLQLAPLDRGFTVERTFVGRHLSLVGLESSSQVIVRPSGVAVVENSLLALVFGATPSVRNEGVLILQHTALLAWSAVGVPTTAFVNTGSAHVAALVLQSYGGSTAPLSPATPRPSTSTK